VGVERNKEHRGESQQQHQRQVLEAPPALDPLAPLVAKSEELGASTTYRKKGHRQENAPNRHRSVGHAEWDGDEPRQHRRQRNAERQAKSEAPLDSPRDWEMKRKPDAYYPNKQEVGDRHQPTLKTSYSPVGDRYTSG
jgi:hypothetical protein